MRAEGINQEASSESEERSLAFHIYTKQDTASLNSEEGHKCEPPIRDVMLSGWIVGLDER